MEDKYLLAAIGSICITAGTVAGIAAGHNGTLLATGIAAVAAIIAGTIGYTAGKTSK